MSLRYQQSDNLVLRGHTLLHLRSFIGQLASSLVFNKVYKTLMLMELQKVERHLLEWL